MEFRINVYHRDDGPGDQYLTVYAETEDLIPHIVLTELGEGWCVGAVFPQA